MNRITFDELKRQVRASGSFFFEEATMRFFSSRCVGLPWQTDRGVLFVTSERDARGHGWSGERRYTLRLFDGKRIDSIGGFGHFASRGAALRALDKEARQ